MRVKKEAMVSSQPEDEHEISRSGLRRSLLDAEFPAQSVTQVEPCVATSKDREAAGTKVEITQMDVQVSEQPNVIAEQSEGRNVTDKMTKVVEKVPDFALLYFTLVADQAVSDGYLDQFLTLEPHVRGVAERADRLNGKITNLSAAHWLHNQNQHGAEEAKIERTAVDQLVLASELKPRRFRTRYQAASFQGPTARQDAETSERNK